jgi:hypothetical protein
VTQEEAGVDVMITIFCDLGQFLAKKMAFFSKTKVMIKLVPYLALFLVKNANFLGELKKNHNIGVWFTRISKMRTER